LCTEGEVEAERRRALALQAEVRRQQALVDDFKARAAAQAAERAELSAAKVDALAAARRAELTAKQLADDLAEQKTLASFLEGKVVDLSKELSTRASKVASSPPAPSAVLLTGPLEEAYAENKSLRAELKALEDATAVRVAELEARERAAKERNSALEDENKKLARADERARAAEAEMARLRKLLSRLERTAGDSSAQNELLRRAMESGNSDALADANAEIERLRGVIATMGE